MASVATPEAVWVGFMDVVPVIGKLKEGVEWVLALYEGNQKVVKETEKVIEKFLTHTPESLMLEKSTMTETPPTSEEKGEKGATAAGVSASELQSVTEIQIEELLEYVRKGQAEEKAEQKKKVEKIKKEIQEKIQLIKPNFKMAIKLSTEMRSKRGEHVFNNNLLAFHSKVLKHYNDILDISNYRRRSLTHLCRHTLDEDATDKITKDMIATFEMTEIYVNANAILYSIYSKELYAAYLHMLDDLQSEDHNRAEQVNTIIDLMNNFEIYVDQMAKAKYINNNCDKQSQFNDVKDKVIRMYKNERGVPWCEEVKEIIKKEYLVLGNMQFRGQTLEGGDGVVGVLGLAQQSLPRMCRLV